MEGKSRWLRRNSAVALINVHLAHLGGGDDEGDDERRVGSWSRSISQRSLEGVGYRQTYPFRESACGHVWGWAQTSRPFCLSSYSVPPCARHPTRIPLYSPTGTLQSMQSIRVPTPPSDLRKPKHNALRASAHRRAVDAYHSSSLRVSPFYRPASSRAARVDSPLAPTRVHYCPVRHFRLYRP